MLYFRQGSIAPSVLTMSYLNQFVLHCHANLLDNTDRETTIAKNYLSDRNIKKESVILHNIGYCSYKDDIPEEIAFFGKDKKDRNCKGYYYFIKGKIIVPIYSEFGYVVGFATRKPSFEPGNTWWNISKPFQKSNHLFLLDKARKKIFQENKIFLVEGYIDAIILHQEGIKNVVGLMGINLSPRQIGLMSRYCENICLCLDVDINQSGQRATDKIIYNLKKFDSYDNLSIIKGMPVGEDPDVFITKNGIDSFMKLEEILSKSEITRIYKKVSSELKDG